MIAAPDHAGHSDQRHQDADGGHDLHDARSVPELPEQRRVEGPSESRGQHAHHEHQGDGSRYRPSLPVGAHDELELPSLGELEEHVGEEHPDGAVGEVEDTRRHIRDDQAGRGNGVDRADAEADRRPSVPHETVAGWLRSWGTENELPSPNENCGWSGDHAQLTISNTCEGASHKNSPPLRCASLRACSKLLTTFVNRPCRYAWSLEIATTPRVAACHLSCSSTSATETLNDSRILAIRDCSTRRFPFRSWLAGIESRIVQMPTTMRQF